jgi:Protein of unknown function (DUF3019)
MYRLASILLVFMFGTLPRSGQAADEPVSLTVKPSLCIADQFSPSCTMKFQLRWQSLRSGDFCVNNDLQPLPLRCWGQARSGDLQEQRIVSQDFSYWLTEPLHSERQAVVKVEVLRIGSNDRRRERRTRHIWDVL